jgi:NAD(P)-dependent dehydrogenase (short-subunit alcohol dehydrogenase family)
MSEVLPRRLAGRVVLVTGAGKGIGRAIARRFAAEGAKVACLDLDGAAADETVAGIGADALAVCGDVTDPAKAEAAVAATLAAFGKLQGLVNNAAAPSKDGTVATLALADWNREISVSLTGAFLMSKFAVPAIAAAGGGSVVHVASQFAHVAVAGSAAYCAAKAGLLNLARVMALDHAGEHIRVNTLSPGAVATHRLVDYHGSLAAAERELAPKHPIGRIGRPEEIAAAAAFLMSEDSSFMTGADLLVDGGYSAW